MVRRSWWATGAKGAGEPGAERVQSLHGCGGGKEEFSSPFIIHGGWRLGASWGQHIAEARAKPLLHRAACSREEEKWEEKGFCG